MKAIEDIREVIRDSDDETVSCYTLDFFDLKSRVNSLKTDFPRPLVSINPGFQIKKIQCVTRHCLIVRVANHFANVLNGFHQDFFTSTVSVFEHAITGE